MSQGIYTGSTVIYVMAIKTKWQKLPAPTPTVLHIWAVCSFSFVSKMFTLTGIQSSQQERPNFFAFEFYGSSFIHFEPCQSGGWAIGSTGDKYKQNTPTCLVSSKHVKPTALRDQVIMSSALLYLMTAQ